MPTERYLDYNATAPLRPEARAAMVSALDCDGNASSVHRAGRAARALIEEAREAVAELVGAHPAEVIFTSGATEANATLLQGSPEGPRLASAGEHDSVLAVPAVEPVALRPDGRIDREALEARLSEAPLVSLMAANNETGVVQPIAEVGAMLRAAGGRMHCDAVQGAGRLDKETWAGADYISFSAHKLGGPKGVGALVVRDEAPLKPLIRGGGQERRLRAGTENVAAIAGFGAAATAVLREGTHEQARLAALRDRFEAGLRDLQPAVVIHGAQAPRLANTCCFSLPGQRAETLLISLDLAGLCLSSGSACSSGKVQQSHVLLAMGVAPEVAAGALRLSLGWASVAEDVEACLHALAQVIEKQKRRVA
ncbi:MAG: cysteine desulfurase family protein [Kiloniellales bacterium]